MSMKQVLLTGLSFLVISGEVFSQSLGLVEAPVVNRHRMVTGTDPLAWKIKKTSWSQEDEVNYSQFVVTIASALERKTCKNIDECLRLPINKYLSFADSLFRFYPVDCARLPYLLRAYFAWKNNLPFSYVSAVTPRDPNDPRITTGGIHYTSFGNQVTRRSNNVSRPNRFASFASFQEVLMNSVYTATLRTPLRQSAGEFVNDHYPVKIDRSEVRPGTLVYYPEGHAGSIFKIANDGSAVTFDGHPGNHLSIRPLGKGYGMRYSRQEWGGGIKNFRPLTLVGATQDSEGNYIGGQIHVALDNEIPGVSYEQTQARQNFSSTAAYMSNITLRLATQIETKDIVGTFKSDIEELCAFSKGREEVVERALTRNIDLLPRRESLPRNLILGDGNSNETWTGIASFGRDANLKLMFKDTLDKLKFNVMALKNKDPRVSYSGQNLKAELMSIYQRTSSTCTIEYRSRNGEQLTQNLETLRNRLFLISSDPQMCPELRWGDVVRSRTHCRQEDLRWFAAQQYIRNMTDRQLIGSLDATMNIEGLEEENRKRNRSVSWDTNFAGFINSL